MRCTSSSTCASTAFLTYARSIGFSVSVFSLNVKRSPIPLTLGLPDVTAGIRDKDSLLQLFPWSSTDMCCVVLYCTVLYCAVLCCAVLCCAVLCCAVLCCAVICSAVLCCAVLSCAVLCYAVLYCALLCCAVLCCAVLFCALLCCAQMYSCSQTFHYLRDLRAFVALD